MNLAPYYAPTFYTPYYYPPLAAQPAGGTAGTATEPFFAPTFFSPYYFPPLAPPASSGTPASNSTVYYAPTFYSPYYYPPLAIPGAGGTGGTGGTPAYRDQDAFDAIVAALVSTEAFADVLFGDPLDPDLLAAARFPVAIVTPDRWVEHDDTDPTMLVRQVSYALTLMVRSEGPGQRYNALDALSSIAQNALDGSTLNGGCLPALTKIRDGRYDTRSRHPEQRLVLDGEFSYLVESYSGHSTV